MKKNFKSEELEAGILTKKLCDKIESILFIFSNNGKVIYANKDAINLLPDFKKLNYEKIKKILESNFYIRTYNFDDNKCLIGQSTHMIFERYFTEFLQELVHRIENPLAGSIGFLGLLKPIVEKDEKALEYINKTKIGLNRIDEIMRSVFPLAQEISSQLRVGDLNSFINNCKKFILKDPIWKVKGITLELKNENKPIITSFDPVMLKLAIDNFFNLFSKKLKKGNKITISTGNRTDKMIDILITVKTDRENIPQIIPLKVISIEAGVIRKIIKEHNAKLINRVNPNGKIEFKIIFPITEGKNVKKIRG